MGTSSRKQNKKQQRKKTFRRIIALIAAVAIALVTVLASMTSLVSAAESTSGCVSNSAAAVLSSESTSGADTLSLAAELLSLTASAADTESGTTTDAENTESESTAAADTDSSSEAVWPSGPSIDSESAIVMEVNTGTVLYEKNADEIHYPASITKIMTTLLAIENCSLDETVTFSATAVYENEGDSSHISRDLGEEMTLEQCLYAVMLASANECAWAVAEHVGGGDCETFVEMMNERAEELGCTNTNFVNPNGLPDDEHVTTCRDMALIAAAAIQNSTFRTITGTVQYTIPPTNKHTESTYLTNHHGMLSSLYTSGHVYEYCIGGKTGYTVAAGNTLVTYAEKDGMLLVCVIMASNGTHYDDTTTLFDWCFDNFETYNVSENETRYSGADVTAGSLFTEFEAFALLDEDAQIILPVGVSFSDTTAELSTTDASDDVLGTLTYSYAGRTVGSADIVATGASAAVYEFSKGSYSSVSSDSSDSSVSSDSSDSSASSDSSLGDSLSAEEESTSSDSDTGSGFGFGFDLDIDLSSFSIDSDLLLRIVILGAACVVVLIILIVVIRRLIRRARRRRNSRGGKDPRYKTITPERRGRRRRRRR